MLTITILETNKEGSPTKIEVVKRNFFRRKLGKVTVLTRAWHSHPNDYGGEYHWTYPDKVPVGYFFERKITRTLFPRKKESNWTPIYLGSGERDETPNLNVNIERVEMTHEQFAGAVDAALARVKEKTLAARKGKKS